MSYRIVVNGTDILDYSQKDMILLEPKLEMEINAAGSLEFVMPPNHKYYTICEPLRSPVLVYENNSIIWVGRVYTVGEDFYRQKRVYCEGPLSWFRDSVQRPGEYEDMTPSSILARILSEHNSSLGAGPGDFRSVSLGNVTVSGRGLYRKFDYESSYDALRTFCLDAEGGHFFFRWNGSGVTMDWLAEMPYTCNQPVEFGLGLVDFSVNWDGSNFYTSALPLGGTIQQKYDEDGNEVETEHLGENLTVEDYSGSDIIDSPAVGTYGRIIKVLHYDEFDKAEDAEALYNQAMHWLEVEQFDGLTIECSAVDLHAVNSNYEPFRLGQMITCHSVPHLLDRTFPLTKMSIDLDTAEKVITLGTARPRTLTKIVKEADEYDTEPTKGSMNGITSNAVYNATTRDDYPTQDSTRIATSGGIYEKLQEKSSWEFQIDGVKVEKGVCNFVTAADAGENTA